MMTSSWPGIEQPGSTRLFLEARPRLGHNPAWVILSLSVVFGRQAMKWILGYAVGAILLVAPAGVRVWLRPLATPGSLDAAAVHEGKMLFTHEWTVNDPLCPTGDGLGPVYNATSCVQCHSEGGVGGSGGLKHNVTTFSIPAARPGKPTTGVIHAHATSDRYQENLTHAHGALPHLERPTLKEIQELERTRPNLVQVGQRNTPALFGAKLIDELPDRVILANERAQKLRWRDPDGRGLTVPVGRALVLADGRVGKFGWKAQSSSLLAFVQAACANELGLGNPGQAQPVPLVEASYRAPGLDLTTQQCQQMAAFIAALPRPLKKTPDGVQGQQSVARGRQLFNSIGCAECHVPDLGSIEGVYSDFLLHRMGGDLVGDGGSYNAPQPSPSPGLDSPLSDEWRTPPLWGVADSAPYLHDGRAATLQEAIMLHGGQAAESLRKFRGQSVGQQADLINFLKSMRAPG
jgi:CxxC motif-containing protein (DUF1111 family)